MNNDISRIENVFGKVSRADAHISVSLVAKVYPQYIKVYKPNVPYIKKIPFMEERSEGDIEDRQLGLANNKTSNENNVERSLRKTNSIISDLVLMNEFDLFATFTFSPKKSDRANPIAVKIQFANWLRNQRKAIGRFAYLVVPEFHKDGKSLHFHVLMHGYKGQLIKTDKRINGRTVYHFKSYTLGYNSTVKIDDIEAVSSYVKKYITKDMPQFHQQHRFWASAGLKRPDVIDNPNPSILDKRIVREFENEYGHTYFIARDQVQTTLDLKGSAKV